MLENPTVRLLFVEYLNTFNETVHELLFLKLGHSIVQLIEVLQILIYSFYG